MEGAWARFAGLACLVVLGCGGRAVVGSGATPGSSTTTTTTTTTTLTGAATGASTGGGVFLVGPDGGGYPECDNWAQDCPPGQKCSPWANDGGGAWNATKCVLIAEDPRAPGDRCTVQGNGVSGIDDCELGAYCWDVDPHTHVGTCAPLCAGTPDHPLCADPDTDCIITADAVLNICLPTCHPLHGGCSTGDLCLPNRYAFVCLPDADPDNSLRTGDDCWYTNGCDRGHYCSNPAAHPACDPAAPGCCIPFCDLSDSGACPDPGVDCEPWYDPLLAPPGYENLGACVVAA